MKKSIFKQLLKAAIFINEYGCFSLESKVMNYELDVYITEDSAELHVQECTRNDNGNFIRIELTAEQKKKLKELLFEQETQFYSQLEQDEQPSREDLRESYLELLFDDARTERKFAAKAS